jgi:hypothetical protein
MEDDKDASRNNNTILHGVQAPQLYDYEGQAQGSRAVGEEKILPF